MASITIRSLDDDIRTRLRVRAAHNGHSMEEEVRQILRKAVGRAKRSRDLTSIIRSHFGPENGVDWNCPSVIQRVSRRPSGRSETHVHAD